MKSIKIMNTKKCGWALHKLDGNYANHGTDEVSFEMLEGSVAQVTEFARWVSGEIKDYRNDAINGYKALEMLHAVYESARTYSRVTIPMENKENHLRMMIDSGYVPFLSYGRYVIRQICVLMRNTVDNLT